MNASCQIIQLPTARAVEQTRADLLRHKSFSAAEGAWFIITCWLLGDACPRADFDACRPDNIDAYDEALRAAQLIARMTGLSIPQPKQGEKNGQ